MTLTFLRSLLQHSSADMSRSTALHPLGWLLALLLPSALASFYLKLPSWVGTSLLIGVGVAVCLYIFSYLYCLFKDRDALRSEKYSIQKIAIEKLAGDDQQGLIGILGAPSAALSHEKAADRGKQ